MLGMWTYGQSEFRNVKVWMLMFLWLPDFNLVSMLQCLTLDIVMSSTLYFRKMQVDQQRQLLTQIPGSSLRKRLRQTGENRLKGNYTRSCF